MPLYEYECESCQGRFERLQRLADPPVGTCPTCEGKVRKLISPSGLSFKGSGWYITDYARKSETAAAPASDAKEAKGDAKSDVKTDSKTDTKTTDTKPASAPTGKPASPPSAFAEGKPKPSPAATSP